METGGWIIVALAILGFGLVSGRAQRSIVTPPMVFVAVGWLVGPGGLGLLHFEVESEWIHLLAELTLVLVLFTDASRIDQSIADLQPRQKCARHPTPSLVEEVYKRRVRPNCHDQVGAFVECQVQRHVLAGASGLNARAGKPQRLHALLPRRPAVLVRVHQ